MPEVIKSLLRSRAFVASVAAIIATIIVMAVPSLNDHSEFLRNAIIALAALVVGGWKLEDFAAKLNASKVPEDVKDIVAVLTQIVAELANRLPTDTVAPGNETQTTPPNG